MTACQGRVPRPGPGTIMTTRHGGVATCDACGDVTERQSTTGLGWFVVSIQASQSRPHRLIEVCSVHCLLDLASIPDELDRLRRLETRFIAQGWREEPTHE